MSTTPAPLLALELPAIEVAMVGSPLVRAYLAGDPALAPFYGGHPLDPAAYRRKAAEIDARLDASARQRVAGAIRPLGAAAAAKLERVLNGDGYFVTTGQQTGLFTGPLYTIHKALSAIRLAAELERTLDAPVLALFWSAADDHDWEEVDHASVLDTHNYVQRIALPKQPDAVPMAMSHRPLPQATGNALEQLRNVLPDTPWASDYLRVLRAAYVPGRSMAAAFEDALAAVLAGHEIGLVSSAHPLVKTHSAPVLARALREHDAQEQAVAVQTARLAAAGHAPQVSLAAGASNVFAQDSEGRDRLVREQGGWMLRRSRRRLSDADVASWLEREPTAFSPNVLLRPVVESALFPTLAYVGGPAETGYFAQIGCLFLAHGIRPPIAFPRLSVTFVESKVARLLERNGLDARDVRVPFAELLARLVKEDLPSGVAESLARLRADLDAGFAALDGAAAAAGPGLARAVAGARNGVRSRMAEVEKRIQQQVKRQNLERYEQLRRTAANVYPDGAPQERVLNVLPYLARYGPGLLAQVLQSMVIELGHSHPEYGVTCNDGALATPAKNGIA